MNVSRLVRALRVLLPQFFPREPFAYPRKYRAVRMRPSLSSPALTRVELQIVNAATGYPDILIVPAWPGIAGVNSELTPGALVLVQFIDGDSGQPYIAAWSTADDPAWKPVNTTIDATGVMKLGPSAAEVDIASGTDTILTPGLEAGRAVKYGDIIMFPVGSAGTPTAMPILGSAPGASPAPLPPISVSKVRV